MRSPPFRYSITKNRCDWNRKLGLLLLKKIITRAKAGVANRIREKTVAYVCLEGAEEVTEEGVLHPQGENFPLDHRALDVIVLQHCIFLQRLVINHSYT